MSFCSGTQQTVQWVGLWYVVCDCGISWSYSLALWSHENIKLGTKQKKGFLVNYVILCKYVYHMTSHLGLK